MINWSIKIKNFRHLFIKETVIISSDFGLVFLWYSTYLEKWSPFVNKLNPICVSAFTQHEALIKHEYVLNFKYMCSMAPISVAVANLFISRLLRKYVSLKAQPETLYIFGRFRTIQIILDMSVCIFVSVITFDRRTYQTNRPMGISRITLNV